jgi:hypothetical protein
VRVAALRRHPNADFSYGRTSVQDEHGHEFFDINEPWPEPGRARIARYLFDTNSPLMRREIASQVGLWRLDDTHGQEFEYFARLKYFATDAHFIDKPLSIYVKHRRTSLFDKSRSFTLALFRLLFAIKAIIVLGNYDTKEERAALATEFWKVGRSLIRFGDYQLAYLTRPSVSRYFFLGGRKCS